MLKKKELLYALYDNKEQDTLYALAYSEEQLKEITNQYTSGVWFEYDLIRDKFLENERPYEKDVKFPKNVKKEKFDDKLEDGGWLLGKKHYDLR